MENKVKAIKEKVQQCFDEIEQLSPEDDLRVAQQCLEDALDFINSYMEEEGYE